MEKIFRIRVLNTDGTHTDYDYTTLEDYQQALANDAWRCYIKEQTYMPIAKDDDDWCTLVDLNYKWKH